MIDEETLGRLEGERDRARADLSMTLERVREYERRLTELRCLVDNMRAERDVARKALISIANVATAIASGRYR